MRRLSVVMVVVALLAAVGWRPMQKFRLDREVDRLCALDGGVRVFEVVRLPKENFGPNGELFPQYRHLYSTRGHLGPDYVAILENKLLIDGDPALQRVRVAVVRKSDGRILGEFVDYKRSGGDLPGPWEPSRKSCSSSVESGRFYQRLFLKEGS
ncbi:MAG: hypothetical protein F9K36_04305 [Burkholderiaceae bacterium]|nr:MAG: hypothetical protein F9K36_04305 [Burkholderiaceae bacterium]